MPRGLLVCLLLLLPRTLGAQGHAPPRKIEVAEGIFLFITPPYSDVGLDGNSVVIVSNDGVLVFDANGTPAAAGAVLREIRKLTRQPVRYLVLSHWHWDHWYGAEVYRQAFPGIQVIAHEATRRLMMGPAIDFNRRGLEQQLPEHIADVEKALSAARAKAAAPATLAKLERHVQEDRFFLAQKRGVHHTFPNLTFSDSLTLYLGGREIRVLHYDRAVTPGDAFVYLAKERILVTGDLLINPITFALGCYPSGWIATLERLDRIDAGLIIPGHGEPLHDKMLLDTHLALLRELLRQGKAAKERGLTVDQAGPAIGDSVATLRRGLTHDDADLNAQFGIYLLDWFLHRVYDELDGPLTDEIAPIPAH
jgi:glyoxylase-like metal-dependent hydrolase (beta-lactamase superfamily II)